MSFELVLANGKRLVTENASEVYYFHKSNGTRVIPKPRPKNKAPRTKKQNKADEVLATV